MKPLAFVTAVVAVALLAVDASAATHSRVRVVTAAPLVVAGTGFRAHERINVTLRSGAFRRSVTVTSSAAGSFSWRVTALSAPRCGTLSVLAVGARGDRAVWESAARMCGGPLRP